MTGWFRRRALVRGGAASVLAAVLLAPARARARDGGEVSGVVRDAAGAAVVGADVVVTPAVGGGGRRVAITDQRGAFLVPLLFPGSHQVAVYSAWGARLDTLAVDVPAGGRLQLAIIARGAGAASAEPVLARADSLPWLTPTALGPAALAPGRDLAGALSAVPGSPPSPAPGDGPLLFGTDPGQAELRVEGLSLNDPVDGRAPWELPAALWGDIFPHAGLGAAIEGDRGAAVVDLTAARARRRAGGAIDLGSGAAASAAGAGRPDGRAYLGFLEARAEAVGDRWRGTVAAAPTRGAWQADPRSLTAARGRRSTVVPVLARADADFGPWTLTGLGLAAELRQDLSRADATAGAGGAVLAPEEPRQLRHRLLLTGLFLRRPLGPAPAELTLAAGLLASRRREQPVIGGALFTDARRLTFSSSVRGLGHLGGRHLMSAALGVEAEAADRSGAASGEAGAAPGGAFASRQAGQSLLGAEASSYTPYVALDERYFPTANLELEAGLRAEKIFLRALGQRVGAPLPERSFTTDLLWAPRARIAYVPIRFEGTGRLRLQLAAGRFGGRLPLGPLLDITAAPRFGVDVPSEHVASGGADLSLGPLHLSVMALERRMAHLVEDRFSPADGQLELFEPVAARRRYRAIWVELRAELVGVRMAVALLRSSLRGNHLGWLDGATGAHRPGSTEAFDTPAAEINREGPLLLDRPHGARLLLEHGRWLGRVVRLEGAFAARIDGGSPRIALGPNPEGPQSRVFLVEAGTLPRTSAVAAVDAALGVSWLRGPLRGTLRLELLNLGNRRRAVTRDPRYTDVAVTEVRGTRGAAGLGALVDAAGAPVVPRAGYDAPVARAEPFTARLVLGLAL